MPARRKLTLSAEERTALERIRDTAPEPYLRERAGALLKIADGMAVDRVAQEGLLKRRHPENVRNWLNRYQAEGLEGLRIRKGRGRKPAFFPSAPEHPTGAGRAAGRDPASPECEGL